MRHPELGLHDVSAEALHGLGQPRLHGIQPRADDAPVAAPGGRRPPVHGASDLGGRDLLQVRNSVQEADAAARPVHRCEAWQDGRHLRAAERGAAADGGAVREGQPITQAALQRSCCAVQGDCASGHGGPCGAAEHAGLGFLQGGWKMHIFSMFLHVFWAVSLNTKNGAEGHRASFSRFLWRIQKRCHSASKMKQSGTGPF